MLFSENSGRELKEAKIKALLHNVAVQLASHLNVFYTIEFSFKYKGSQQRSICVFKAYIQIILTEFFGGSILSKVGNLQTFCKFLLNLFSYALCE